MIIAKIESVFDVSFAIINAFLDTGFDRIHSAVPNCFSPMIDPCPTFEIIVETNSNLTYFVTK